MLAQLVGMGWTLQVVDTLWEEEKRITHKLQIESFIILIFLESEAKQNIKKTNLLLNRGEICVANFITICKWCELFELQGTFQ